MMVIASHRYQQVPSEVKYSCLVTDAPIQSMSFRSSPKSHVSNQGGLVQYKQVCE